MEQLDKVYSAFTNLEANYKRSKKSRQEYLKDKFGGDIEIGMMVIMDFFSGAQVTSDEDIKKLSTIKDIFAGVKKNINNLDSLSSFKELTENGDANVMLLLDSASIAGSRIAVMTSDTMLPDFHYRATETGVSVVPLILASRIKVFNGSMCSFVQSVLGNKANVEVGEVYMQGKGGTLSLLTPKVNHG